MEKRAEVHEDSRQGKKETGMEDRMDDGKESRGGRGVMRWTYRQRQRPSLPTSLPVSLSPCPGERIAKRRLEVR